jgi:protein TonB
MKEYRLYIAFALSAACHAAMLLPLLPGWSYTPASAMLRRGDNAVTLELVESVEAVARPAPEQTRPVTEVKQEIQRQIETASEQFAALVRRIETIKLPDPPPTPPTPTEPAPPEPVIEPILQATRIQLDRSAEEMAQCAKALEQAVELAKKRAAEQLAAEAERNRQAEQLAKTATQAPAPNVPQEHTRPDGTADLNSQASPAVHGAQGVTCGASAIGDLKPLYPPACVRRGEEGAVTLEWRVLADGHCGWVKVIKSSGNETLDGAAIEAVRRDRHNPARSAGVATNDGVIRTTFRFQIIDRS